MTGRTAAPAGSRADYRSHVSLLFERFADVFGDDSAVIQGDRQLSWAEFDERSARFASVLSGTGLPPGSVVAIDLYNCPEYFEVFHGSLKASMVPANVNYRYVDDELVDLLNGCDARVLVFDGGLSEQIRRVQPRLPRIVAWLQVDGRRAGTEREAAVEYEEALARSSPLARRALGAGFYLSFTGGTTGLPKGVMFNLDRGTRNGFLLRDLFLGRDGSETDDPVDVAESLRAQGASPVTIPASPLMHSAGFIFTSLPTLQAGGSVVLTETRSFDADHLWRTVEQHRATVIGMVGDSFARPMQRALDEAAAAGRPYDLSSLRIVCSAGVAWSASLKRQLLRHVAGVRLVDACGSTEGANYGMRIVDSADRAVSDNFDLMPGVMVLDPDGRRAPPGEIGLLASPTPCDGYYLDPERTRLTFRTIDGQQYTVPGDLGRIEPDGTLTLIGRGTSTVNTGGEKVHPEEVEQVIKELGGVDDVIVLGVPDDRFGSKVAAVVSLRPGAELTREDIDAAVRQRLAAYKAPRLVVFTQTVPRHPNGKPDFTSAAALVAGGTDEQEHS
jgi:acyl-CoA synthetase (AMP-forming)/AMP-acid ligase II